MATTDCTLGTRFAKSKFLAKTYALRIAESFSPSFSFVLNKSTLDEALAELMETLRLQVNALQRLKMPARKRVRLVRGYCEIEYFVKELRLLSVSEFDERESP